MPERGLSLRVTALLSLLAANRAALAGEALVARIAGNHEPAIAASSTACGLAVAAVSAGVGREGDHEGLVRAYALGFAPPFVLFVLLGAGLGAF